MEQWIGAANPFHQQMAFRVADKMERTGSWLTVGQPNLALSYSCQVICAAIRRERPTRHSLHLACGQRER